jgi:hypothetical protein
MPRSIRQLLVAVASVAVLAGSAAAQDVTTTDIQRLEQTLDQVATEIVQLRRTDRAGARTMQAELLEIDEEITYLKVKLRKERRLPRAEYIDVRDRVENLRSRVSNGDTTSTTGSGRGTNTTNTNRNDRNDTGNYPNNSGNTSNNTAGLIPSGTELDVRLETALSSDTNVVEDRFEATTVVDLRQDGRVLIPAGSRVRGVVTAVRDAGRVDRKGSLSLSFDQITVNGRNYPMRGTVTQALESGGYKDDAEKIGTGAAVGGILGGILGGLKGAIAGILIGGGGVVAATEGENVNLAAGSVLRMRLDQDLNVRAGLTRQ